MPPIIPPFRGTSFPTIEQVVSRIIGVITWDLFMGKSDELDSNVFGKLEACPKLIVHKVWVGNIMTPENWGDKVWTFTNLH